MGITNNLIMKKISFLLLVALITSSCGNNSPEKYFENLTTECDYVESGMELINEIESKIGFACNCANKYDDVLNEMDEDAQRDLKIHIVALLQIKREVKLNVRKNDDWSYGDLSNCPKFNKLQNNIDPFDEMDFWREANGFSDFVKDGYPETLVERLKALEERY